MTSLRVSPRRVLAVFGGLSLVFTALGLLAVYWHFRVRNARGEEPWGWVRLVDLNQEMNLPTWYASFGLIVSSAACALAGAVRRSRGEPFARHWSVLAVLFLFLSIDEAIGVHEAVSPAMQETLGTGGLLRFAWVVPYGIAVVVVGLLYLPFLGHLEKRVRGAMVLAGVLYVGGALGLELVEGWWTTRYGWGLGLGLLTSVEEGAEMLGVAVFLTSVAAYLGGTAGEVALAFGSRSRGADVGGGAAGQG